MKRNYSALSLVGITAILCANALVGCLGGSGGRRCCTPNPNPGPECVVETVQISTLVTNTLQITSPTIIVEEFLYTASDPLSGLNGGRGWAAGWSDPNSEFDITAPGLTHPAQTSNTSIAGNNKATGILPVTGAPGAIAGTATRNISGNAIGLINQALNYFHVSPLSEGGLWFRVLMSIPSSPGTGTPTFALNLNGVPVQVSMATGGGGSYTLTFNGVPAVSAHTITPDNTYMFVGNLIVTEAVTGTFTAKLWILDPATSTFSVSATPLTVQVAGAFGPFPVNISNANVQIMDASNDSFDEIYAANSPQGLAINVSP